MTLNCDERAVSQSHPPASRNAVVEYSRSKTFGLASRTTRVCAREKDNADSKDHQLFDAREVRKETESALERDLSAMFCEDKRTSGF